MFERIIVSIDAAAGTEDALALACDLARKYDSQIMLVLCTGFLEIAHAFVEDEALKSCSSHMLEISTQITTKAVKTVTMLGCMADKCIIANGEPVAEMLSQIEKVDADLLIIDCSSHEENAAQFQMVDRVLAETSCVCLTV